MADVLIRRGNLDKDMHTGRTPCEDVGRDGVLLLQAKEPKVDIRPLEAGRGLRRASPADISLGFLASRTLRQCILLFK